MPVRALGELLAVLAVGPKRTGAPFNQEDVALLETITSFGGLALHHAYVLEELDRLRRADLDAAGREKRATVAALGREIAHELTYSVSYFRFFLMRARVDAAVSADDIENAGDEIERLARMLAALRHFALPPAEIRCVAITGPIRQAQSLVREGLTEKAIRFEIEHTEPMFVRADRDQLVQVLANLFRNAVDAVEDAGSIRVVCSCAAGWVTIRVIDDGPGIPSDLSERLFTPLLAGETRGMGVGLVVAAGMVRGWGGTLDHRRSDDLTDFFMVLPEAEP
jgi:C4-dicarboxylate-specific signal transduction histidine kinase